MRSIMLVLVTTLCLSNYANATPIVGIPSPQIDEQQILARLNEISGIIFPSYSSVIPLSAIFDPHASYRNLTTQLGGDYFPSRFGPTPQTSTTVVEEPPPVLLMIGGVLALFLLRRRRT